jgi:hypothetical protein
MFKISFLAFFFPVTIDLFLLAGHNLAGSFLRALEYPAALHTNTFITVQLPTPRRLVYFIFSALGCSHPNPSGSYLAPVTFDNPPIQITFHLQVIVVAIQLSSYLCAGKKTKTKTKKREKECHGSIEISDNLFSIYKALNKLVC